MPWNAARGDWSCCSRLICIPSWSNWHNGCNWQLLSDRRCDGDLLDGLYGDDGRRSRLELGHDWLRDDRLLLLDNWCLKILDCMMKLILLDCYSCQLG